MKQEARKVALEMLKEGLTDISINPFDGDEQTYISNIQIHEVRF